RTCLAPSHLAAMRGELHTGVGHQSVARFDLQQSGGARILAATARGAAEDLDAGHVSAAGALGSTSALLFARLARNNNRNCAALHTHGASQRDDLVGDESAIKRRVGSNDDAIGRDLLRGGTLVEGNFHALQINISGVADRNIGLTRRHLIRSQTEHYKL